MAPSNRDRIGRAMELLGPALDRFLASVLDAELGGPWIGLVATGGGPSRDYDPRDPQNGLRVLTDGMQTRVRPRWYPFDDRLSRKEKSWADELKDVRNDFAHMKPFSNDDAQRALDTTERFLRAIGAPTEAEQVKLMRLELRRVSAEREDEAVARTFRHTTTIASDNLPPWREIVRPHDDILHGTQKAADFAADLHTVAETNRLGQPGNEYSDPRQFFARTYLTRGLSDLLVGSARRLAGDPNAAPVVNLQTNFGGGKTHSMLALWHLASGLPLSELSDDVAELLRDTGVDDVRQRVQRVALVGNQLEATGIRHADGTSVNTLWGELAWQLGGQEAYDLIADADRAGTNPGASLRELLTLYSPAVILIDEWVAYARQLYGREDVAGGTFDTQFTFAQTLTEAAATTPGIQVVISIPAGNGSGEEDVENNEEVGGDNGREALRRLKRIVGRNAEHWRPADATESFEIVRRRIFRARDAETIGRINAIADRISTYYAKYAADLPPDASSRPYRERIARSYPIHPEFFDRLYEDWSTLDRFQRTRGVLRLMSTIVERLWAAGGAEALIMPGYLPIDDDAVSTELTGYLEDKWKAVVDADVSGASSSAFEIDAAHSHLGQRHTTQRLARSIFLAATPRLHTAHKGVEKPRIFLGTALPGDVPGNFHAALDHLANQATYLMTDGPRYWFDTQMNTTRRAREYADGLSAVDVAAEARRRLEAVRKESRDTRFAGVLVFPDSADVGDEQQTRLVIAPLDRRHRRRAGDSPAIEWASDVVQRRGGAGRLHRNTIVVLAADEKDADLLDKAIRNHLAWQHVVDERDALQLSGQQERQAASNVAKWNDIVAARLADTFVWLLHPTQHRPDEKIAIEALQARGTTRDLIARAADKLHAESLLSVQRNAQSIHDDLAGLLARHWNTDGHITLRELFDYYTRYPFLARLRNRDALTASLSAAWESFDHLPFGFADGWDGSEYDELRLPQADTFPPAFTDSLLIIEPGRAEGFARRQAEEWGGRRGKTGGGPGSGAGAGAGGTPAPPTEARPTRYFGSVQLAGPSYARGFAQVTEEVLALLAGVPGAELDVRLEIGATAASGFDDRIRRAVQENGTVLGFTDNEFDAD